MARVVVMGTNYERSTVSGVEIMDFFVEATVPGFGSTIRDIPLLSSHPGPALPIAVRSARRHNQGSSERAAFDWRLIEHSCMVLDMDGKAET